MEPKSIDRRILIMSDLHLGAGTNPNTGQLTPVDEFGQTQTNQWVRLLTNEWARAAGPRAIELAKELKQLNVGSPVPLAALPSLVQDKKYEITLCLNGDIFDVLQTCEPHDNREFPDGLKEDGTLANTPANVIVQLNVVRDGHPEFFRGLASHLLLGHRVDLLPGNHDRHLQNDHVWQGSVDVDGKLYHGVVGLIRKELYDLGASEEQVRDALSRLNRKPFGIYGDVWVEHGDSSDPFNRSRRPYSEMISPTPLHHEMSMALADYGVRRGFNDFEPLDPSLDNYNLDSWDFWSRALAHPFKTFKLIAAFVSALSEEGYEQSPEAETQARVADIQAMVAHVPELEAKLMAMQSETKHSYGDLSDAYARKTFASKPKRALKDALEDLERASARPFTASFPKGSGVLSRVWDALTGALDGRSPDESTKDRFRVLHKQFGINTLIQGHTHKAKDEDERMGRGQKVRYINTHTWIQRLGDWGEAKAVWGEDSRGVAVVELSKGGDGKVHSTSELYRIADASGQLVTGDIRNV